MRNISFILGTLIVILFSVPGIMHGQINECDDFTEKEIDSISAIFKRLKGNQISEQYLFEERKKWTDSIKLEIKWAREKINNMNLIDKEILENLLDISFNYYYADLPDSAIRYLNLLDTNDIRIKGLPDSSKNNIFLNMGQLYMALHRYALAREYLTKAQLGRIENVMNVYELHIFYNQLITSNIETNNYNIAVEYMRKNDSILKIYDNRSLLADMYNNISGVFIKIGLYDTAKCNLIQSVKENLRYISEKTINNDYYEYEDEMVGKDELLYSISNTLSNLTLVYFELQEIEMAVKVNNIVYDINSRIISGNFTFDLAGSTMYKGVYYLRQNKAEDAEKYFKQALQRAYLEGNKTLIPEIYNYYAEYLYAVNKKDEARDTLMQSKYLSDQFARFDIQEKLKTLIWLIKINLENHDTLTAANYILEKDSMTLIIDAKKSKLISDFMYLLSNANAKVNAEKAKLRKQNYILVVIIGVSIVLIAIVLILLHYYRRALKSVRISREKVNVSTSLLTITSDQVAHEMAGLAEERQKMSKRNMDDSDRLDYEKKVIQLEASLKTLESQIDKQLDLLNSGTTINIEEMIDSSVVVKPEAPVIIDSTLKNSFNKLGDLQNENYIEMFKVAVNAIQESNDKMAIRYLNLFNSEYSKEQPNKSKLNNFWDKIMTILPNITSISEFGLMVSQLFG